MHSPNSFQQSHTGVKIVNTGCCHDCGGRCVLKAHVKDGKILRLESDTGEDPQIRACMRGRAYRQRLYSPRSHTSGFSRTTSGTIAGRAASVTLTSA